MATLTGNEALVDAVVRRQIAIQRYSAGLVGEINDLLDATEGDVARQLTRRLAAIVDKGFDTGPDTTARLRVLRDSIKEIRADAIAESQQHMTDSLRQLGKDEIDYLANVYQSHSPVELELALPNLATMGSIISKSPFEGNLMKDWAKKLARDDLDRIMSSVRLGLTEGEGINDIARRILGTVSADGADGALQLTRRNAEAIARTSVGTVVNDARQEFFAENDDIFDVELYVATLDGRTTPQCRALDGQRFKIGQGPIPPVHWNCRSTRVALLNGKVLGNRPAVGATADMLDGLSRKERSAKIRELTGIVPASTTYQQFLKRQTADFQNDVLGATRAKLFRKGGVTLDKFVNRKGDQITLADLRKLEPEAFRRAGLFGE